MLKENECLSKGYKKLSLGIVFTYAVRIYVFNNEYYLYSDNGVSLKATILPTEHFSCQCDVYFENNLKLSYSSDNGPDFRKTKDYFMLDTRNSVLFQLKNRNVELFIDKLKNSTSLYFITNITDTHHYAYAHFPGQECLAEFKFYLDKDDDYIDECNLYHRQPVLSNLIVKSRDFYENNLFSSLDDTKHIAMYNKRHIKLYMKYDETTQKGLLSIRSDKLVDIQELILIKDDFFVLFYEKLLLINMLYPSVYLEKIIKDYNLDLLDDPDETLKVIDMILV